MTDSTTTDASTAGGNSAVAEPTITPDIWERVCPLDKLLPGRGAAARVGDRQIALFRIAAEHVGAERDADADAVFALDNKDPFSGAHVLARGIVGDAGGVLKVASPVYKQNFDLRTGACLDDDGVRVTSYPVAIGDDGWVSVGVPSP
jgi:nitrite reductase (NADH) small subunit